MQHQRRSICQLLPYKLFEPEKARFSFIVQKTKLVRTCVAERHLDWTDFEMSSGRLWFPKEVLVSHHQKRFENTKHLSQNLPEL